MKITLEQNVLNYIEGVIYFKNLIIIYILEQNVCRVEEWLVTCNEIMLLNYEINVIVFCCITEVKCVIQLVTNQI